MPGIDLRVASHKLSIFREAQPVAQKRRKMGGEKREAAKAEVQKLISTGFIKEATYTTWLANIVLVTHRGIVPGFHVNSQGNRSQPRQVLSGC